MKILALDIATNTGWAVGGFGNPIIFGSRSFKNYAGHRAIMGSRFAVWLNQIIEEHKPTHMGIEAPLYSNGGAPQLLIPLTYEAEKAAVRHALDYAEFAPNTVKKFMTGSGRATKEEMIEEAKLFGLNPRNSDQADAIAVLKLRESRIDAQKKAL